MPGGTEFQVFQARSREPTRASGSASGLAGESCEAKPSQETRKPEQNAGSEALLLSREGSKEDGLPATRSKC